MTLTLQEAQERYLKRLEKVGKSKRTIGAYRNDLRTFSAFFREDWPLEKVTLVLIGRFLKSPILTSVERTQTERALVSHQRIVRVIRQFFIWAQSEGLIESLPLPKSIPLGRSRL